MLNCRTKELVSLVPRFLPPNPLRPPWGEVAPLGVRQNTAPFYLLGVTFHSPPENLKVEEKGHCYMSTTVRVCHAVSSPAWHSPVAATMTPILQMRQQGSETYLKSPSN